MTIDSAFSIVVVLYWVCWFFEVLIEPFLSHEQNLFANQTLANEFLIWRPEKDLETLLNFLVMVVVEKNGLKIGKVHIILWYIFQSIKLAKLRYDTLKVCISETVLAMAFLGGLYQF